MNAKELRAENKRLHELLTHAQSQLTRAQKELKQRHAQHEAVTAQFSERLEEKDRQLALLEHQIKLLLQRVRGSRQERINPDQLMLFSLEELRQIAEQLKTDPSDNDLIEVPKHSRRRRSRGRVGKLPDHLEREIIRHELADAELACPCCGDRRQEIGVESSEQLELIPARLKVIEHHRVKYACRRCEEHVAIAPKPPNRLRRVCPRPACVPTRC